MRTMSAGEARRALAAMDRDTNAPGGVGTWLKRGIAALAILALLTLGWGWAAGWFSTPPQVAEVRAVIHQQIADLDKVAKGLAPYEGGPDMRKVFGSMRDLPEGMRDRVRGDIGRLMEATERAQVDSYFLLPPAQRQAELDRRLKADQDRRKQFTGGRGGRGQGGAPPGPSNAQQGGGGQGNGGRVGAGGGGPGGRGGQGGGGGGPRGGSEEDRNNRRKAALDNTDPEQRSRRAEYRRQIEERRQQQGGRR